MFYQQLLDAVRADADVAAASLAATYPLTVVDGASAVVEIDGYDAADDDQRRLLFNIVAPGYFRTLGIRLVSGREFLDRDDPSSAQVALVNETFARHFWGTPADALGTRVRLEGGAWRTVVGVARDVKYARVNEAPRPYVYLPFLQAYTGHMILHAHGRIRPERLLARAREHIQSLDPTLPILDAKSLSDQTGAALEMYEMSAAALFVVGMAALSLAALGMYGLVAYTVRQSTHEIGIRMALGARRVTVVRQYVARGLRLAAIGAALGLVASLIGMRLLAGVLYGVSPTDPASFGTAAAVVMLSVLLATLVPAWKAARTNLIAALRHR